MPTRSACPGHPSCCQLGLIGGVNCRALGEGYSDVMIKGLGGGGGGGGCHEQGGPACRIPHIDKEGKRLHEGRLHLLPQVEAGELWPTFHASPK